jgi:hypothetical protein
MAHYRTFLLIGSALALAACDGAANIASPGDGVIVTPTPTPTPTPTQTPTPTPTPTGPADTCPTGTANVGVINSLRNCQIASPIVGNFTLQNLRGVIYSLSGPVQVGRDLGADAAAPLSGGAQGILTIEPGTVVFASSGNDSLVVNRGSQLFAEGTSTSPIIFTSRANIEGTATTESQNQWGGIVMLGRAPIHTCIAPSATPGSVTCENLVEGLTGSLYGGNSPLDNSGRLRYVQARFSGFAIAPGNELQALTLGGVGSSTTIEYFQAYNSGDDGIEWFGGRVNARYLALIGSDDDNLDTDLGYKGFLQFVLAIQRTSVGDRMIEASTTTYANSTPRDNVRLANFTFISNRDSDPVLLRGNTDYALYNGVISNTLAGIACVDIDDAAGTTTANPGADELGAPIFRSVLFGCSTLSRDDSNINGAATTAIIQPTGVITNNVVPPFSLTLQNVFLPGPFETAAVPFDVTTVPGNSFFVAAPYVGAFRNASDTWYAGWTCGFGGGPSCISPPANTGK